MTVSVAVADPPEDRSTVTLLPVWLEFVNVIDGLFATIGLTVKETVTFPVNVLMLVRVRVLELDEPRGLTKEVGLTPILKSGTVTVMLRSVG